MPYKVRVFMVHIRCEGEVYRLGEEGITSVLVRVFDVNLYRTLSTLIRIEEKTAWGTIVWRNPCRQIKMEEAKSATPRGKPPILGARYDGLLIPPKPMVIGCLNRPCHFPR